MPSVLSVQFRSLCVQPQLSAVQSLNARVLIWRLGTYRCDTTILIRISKTFKLHITLLSTQVLVFPSSLFSWMTLSINSRTNLIDVHWSDMWCTESHYIELLMMQSCATEPVVEAENQGKETSSFLSFGSFYRLVSGEPTTVLTSKPEFLTEWCQLKLWCFPLTQVNTVHCTCCLQHSSAQLRQAVCNSVVIRCFW